MQQKKRLPTYLSIDEAAKVMSVSTRTIPAYHCGRRHSVIRPDELEGALRRIPTIGW